jgi:hypothetical protein
MGMYLGARAPTAADVNLGAIYPVRIHQSTVYLTRTQTHFYNKWIVDLGFCAGAPIMLYEILRRRKSVKDAQPE